MIGINREVDAEAAEEISKLFVEAIIAPSFTPEAVACFAAKKNLRLLETAAGHDERGQAGARAEAGLRRVSDAGCRPHPHQ